MYRHLAHGDDIRLAHLFERPDGASLFVPRAPHLAEGALAKRAARHRKLVERQAIKGNRGRNISE